MNDLDLENFKIIGGLVKDYFSLSKKGLDIFNEALFNHEKRMSYIPEKFRSMIGEDYRARFTVDSLLKENLDDGWNVFKNVFNYFMDDHKITYENYVTNKIIVDKNEMKLFKYLKKWYLEQASYIQQSTANRASNEVNTSRWEDRDNFEVMFKRVSEKIGTMKLPNKDLEIVMSFNFADWFLCSTGEEWSSCLNLESDYEACFWSGLPGLITDPNRMMFYITEGNKSKTYRGIRTEKFITRSWGLFGYDNVVYPQRHYPQKMLEDKAFKNLFPFEVHHEILENYEDFRGNRNITDLITNTYNESIFIYQDYTNFEVVGSKKVMNSNNFVETYNAEVSMVSGGSGYHKIVFGDGEPYASEDIQYDYTEGLSGLIERGTQISDFEDDGSTCSDCGDRCHEDDMIWGADESMYCESCYGEHFVNCEHCGESLWRDNAHESPRGFYYCEEHFEERFSYCDQCETVVNNNDTNHIDDETLCDECFEEKYTVCDKCDKTVRIDETHDHEGDTFCRECIKEKIEEKEEEGVA